MQPITLKFYLIMKPFEATQFISLFNKLKGDIKFEVYSSNGTLFSIEDIELVKSIKIKNLFLDDDTKFIYKVLFQIKIQ